MLGSAESGESKIASPLQSLEVYRQEILSESVPRQLFSVCRMDGEEELKLDIFGNYKDKKKNFRAEPRVRFENEVGVGSGPVREFLLSAMRIVDEGLGSSGAATKPIIFFEGEKNHRIPIHDQSLRLMGSYQAVGRIIGHCALMWTSSSWPLPCCPALLAASCRRSGWTATPCSSGGCGRHGPEGTCVRGTHEKDEGLHLIFTTRGVRHTGPLHRYSITVIGLTFLHPKRMHAVTIWRINFLSVVLQQEYNQNFTIPLAAWCSGERRTTFKCTPHEGCTIPLRSWPWCWPASQ